MVKKNKTEDGAQLHSTPVTSTTPASNKALDNVLLLDIGLFIFTALLYVNSVNAEFVYDDVVAVIENKVRFWFLTLTSIVMSTSISDKMINDVKIGH
jgi:hypothetical protein